jgi:hypothetical protein
LIPDAVEQANKLEAEILQAARSPDFNIDALHNALIAAQLIQRAQNNRTTRRPTEPG